jgi:hypothetical protein
MDLNADIVKRVEALDFLNIKDFFPDKYVEIDNLNFAEKKINSIKWENFILDRMGDFTVYLFKNHNDAYNQFWNKMAENVRKNIKPGINDKLDKIIENNKLKQSMKSQIIFDLINVIIILSYNEYHRSPFFEELLEVYEHGYIPCGWIMDVYPKGQMVIYGKSNNVGLLYQKSKTFIQFLEKLKKE